MNILIRYIEKGEKHREEYAYTLINLFEYAKLGAIDLNRTLSVDDKIHWQEKANEYRDEIAKLIMKGLK